MRIESQVTGQEFMLLYGTPEAESTEDPLWFW